MAVYPIKSRCFLVEYPGYTCYLTYLPWQQDRNLVRLQLQQGTHRVSMYGQYCDYTRNGYYCLVPETQYGALYTSSHHKPEPGSRLFVHPSCRVPTSILNKYNVITSVSADCPEYVVMPERLKIDCAINDVLLFAHHDAKVMIALSMPNYGNPDDDPLSDNLQDYIECMKNSLGGIIPYIDNFVPVSCSVEDQYNIVKYSDETQYLLLHDMMPAHKVVSEYSLSVGESELTYDIFKSCYLMMNSSDDEMRHAALLTLAQHDCRRFTQILRWMFKMNNTARRDVYDVKRKNKPFRWLHDMVTKDGSYIDKITEVFSKHVGRRLVTELTDGNVRWDSDNFIQTAGYVYPTPELRTLACKKLN